MTEPASRSPLRALSYPALIAAALGVFFLVRSAGASLAAPVRTAVAATRAPTSAVNETLLHVLLALLVILVVARVFGAIGKRLNQPPVIGEVIAGIVLGPSLLGRVAPGASAYLFPTTTAPFLSVLAQIGVILFMFLVGLELDTGRLRSRVHATVAISHASIVVPFALGSVLALFLYPRFGTSDVSFTLFALFLGISLSVTAFPVLARILTDRGIHKTQLGVVALTCAAVDDATAWCLLAFLVALTRARASGALVTFGLTGAYVAVMLLAVRPVVERAVRSMELRKTLSQNAVAATMVALLASTLATEATGIHAIFGAFLLGAIIPHDSLLARELTHKLEDIVVIVFLPAFFAFTGLRTQIGLVHGVGMWMICALIIAVASLGKFGGTFVAARVAGMGGRDAAALGILMNTRGLMELIVLNVGLDLGILSPTLFAMLVIMAVVTTVATTPILQLITKGERELDAPPLPL